MACLRRFTLCAALRTSPRPQTAAPSRSAPPRPALAHLDGAPPPDQVAHDERRPCRSGRLCLPSLSLGASRLGGLVKRALMLCVLVSAGGCSVEASADGGTDALLDTALVDVTPRDYGVDARDAGMDADMGML